MKKIITILLLLTMINGLFAQHNWIRTNPGGGGAINISGATRSGLLVTAGDLSGAYVSANNGASWKVIGKTQGLTHTHISAFGFNPTPNSNTFIIGTGLGAFKTKDGGENVYPVNMEVSPNKGIGYVESIDMAMSDANIGYMAHYEWWEPQLSFLKTIDAGENWTKVAFAGMPADARIVKILVDANDANLVYALTGKARFTCSDPFLYRSPDGGKNWTRIATDLTSILDFDLNPTNSKSIYASTFKINPAGCNVSMWDYIDDVGETYKSTNGGLSFQEIFSNFGGIISVGTDTLKISVVDIIFDNGTWKTPDNGDTWTNPGHQENWFQGWLKGVGSYTFSSSSNGFVKSLTKDRFNPERLYGAFGYWSWLSTDGGTTINNVSTKEVTPGHFLSTGVENIEGNWIEVNDNDPNHVYIGGYDIGFWHSSNHGASWKRSLPNITDYDAYSWWAGGGSNCNFVVSDPTNPAKVWAAFSEDQPDTKSAIFKSTDYGDTWTMSNTGLNNLGLSTHGLTVDTKSPANNRTLYVTQEGDVWKSTDDGVTWSKIFANGGLKFTEVDKFDNKIIYAGGNTGFYRSTDSGMTWTKTGLDEMGFAPSGNMTMYPDIIPEDDVEDNNGDITIIHWQGVFDIKADPNIANRVYVVSFGENKGLYVSNEAGAVGTWTKLYTNSRMRGIAIAPGNSNTIYLSSSTNYHSGNQNDESIGIWVSYDAGATWASANDGLAWTNGGRMEIEKGANPHIWAWVPGIGIHHAAIPNFVLPVEMLSPFSARLQGSKVILKWETSEEIQNEGYQIYRSKDARHWTLVQSVQPTNNKKYLAIDTNPIQGISYYKLTQKDLDGTVSNLGMETIRFQKTMRPQVYPNPSSGSILITFDNANINNIELQLFDNLGQLLLTQKNNNRMDISNIAKGSYHLVIKQDASIWHERILKE